MIDSVLIFLYQGFKQKPHLPELVSRPG